MARGIWNCWDNNTMRHRGPGPGTSYEYCGIAHAIMKALLSLMIRKQTLEG